MGMRRGSAEVRKPGGLANALILSHIVALVVGAPAAAAPAGGALGVPPPAAGESRLIAGSWFQYLGRSEEGRDLWLYPHLDGVAEVFEAGAAESGDDEGEAGDEPPWRGLLGSRFAPASGAFSSRFDPAELLNEALEPGVPPARRREAARLLSVFLELHGSGRPPHYLASSAARIRGLLRGDDADRVRETLAAHAAAVRRVGRPGTAVPGLERPRGPEEGPAEYYRRLIADGYLDVAVIGGNLETEAGHRYSWSTLEEWRERLDRLGFERAACRDADDPVLSCRTVTLLDRPIRVRIRVTGGSERSHRIRRAIANFVEGLAHADIVLYHGHSNGDSGAYYTSEVRSELSRFRIGGGATADLVAKLHDLGSKPHQIVAFQSCWSYEKYCRPVRWFLEDSGPREGAVGFLGNTAKADMRDFAPRFGAFLEMLLEGRGARDIADRLDRIRPTAGTPPMVLRGVLQPRFSFIVPDKVEIVEREETDIRSGNLVVGRGSDGREYPSTEVFPQNRPGEVVQAVLCPLGVIGLRDDGTLLVAGRKGAGASRETRISSRRGERFRFVGEAPLAGAIRVLLIDATGALRVLDGRTGAIEPVRRGAPDGVIFRAVAGTPKGRLVAEDDAGRWLEWDPREQTFRPLDARPEISVQTPSLRGDGGPARLWTPEGRGAGR